VSLETLADAEICWTPNPKIFAFLTMLSGALQEIWRGEKTTQEALDDLAAEVDSMHMLE
jgi:hypothetical protein